jgi:hypothetical protein
MPVTKRNQLPTSIYLRREDRALLDALCQRTGEGPTAVVRLGLRELATRYDMAADAPGARPKEDER